MASKPSKKITTKDKNGIKLIKDNCIAITGSIATGKSTLAKMIAANGYSVIDADASTEVVEPETKGLQMIAETFGDHVITSSGELDRQALRTIVFETVKN